MSLLVTPLRSTAVGPGRTASATSSAATASTTPVRSTAPDAVRDARADGARSIRPGGVRGWQPDLNRTVAQAQQSRVFLDDVATRLHGLKSDLSASLAGRVGADARLEESRDALATAWNARAVATGGALDPQLRFTGPDEATRRFTVGGLDFASLRTGERETLVLSIGALGQRPLPVVAEPGLSDEAIVQRLGQALAPAQVRASKDDAGRLTLAVAESQWTTVRDTLAVRGGGRRFPTGQFHRVRAEPEADAVPAATWKTGTADERKTALHGVLTSLDRVRDAQARVGRTLADAAASVESGRPAEGASWAAATAGAFEVAAVDGRFATRAALVSAVEGLDRRRVTSVLQAP